MPALSRRQRRAGRHHCLPRGRGERRRRPARLLAHPLAGHLPARHEGFRSTGSTPRTPVTSPSRQTRIALARRSSSSTARSRSGNLIRRQAGIFIAAHIDEPRGTASTLPCDAGRVPWVRAHRERFGCAYRGREAGLGGVPRLHHRARSRRGRDHQPEDRQHYANIRTPEGKTHRIPCVSRSDHHCVEDFAREELTTWVKVARHDFSSVVDALGFFETRIRFKDDLPKTPSPRLIGLRLRSPSTEGLFEDAVIAFNPNLNCLIGPRGSGKSTVVEALRYVLGLNSALDVIRAEQGMQLDYGEIARRIQDANLKDTLIEVIYQAEDESRYCLSATFDPGDAVPSVYALDGTNAR